MGFSPDGTRVAVGGSAPAVVDARTHRLLSGLRIGQDRYISAIRFSPDGRTLFAVLAFHAVALLSRSGASTRAPAEHLAASSTYSPRPLSA